MCSQDESACECDRCIVKSMLCLLSEYSSGDDSCPRCVLCSRILDTTTFAPQSGNEQTVMRIETMKSQNVRFTDQYSGPTTMVEKSTDWTRSIADTSDTELSDFFSRPIKIQELTWGVGAPISTFLDPWTTYFSNPRVENRITNYNLLRADLHLKFVINGNGFYYGRAFAAYCPHYSDDDLTNAVALEDFVQWSQMPKVFLDPTTSMGGELVIPFHHRANAASIRTNEYDQLGRLWIFSPNVLAHSNGATTPVTVQVFAWAENVDLSVLTSTDIAGLTPQSGEEVDEANTKGIVSGPATAISKVAGALSSIPVIGPYATATSRAASVTAAVAGALGYCKPNVTKAPDPYRPTPLASLATTNVPDTSQKLTVDHKQELTIDPVICGYGDGTDLMSIKSIAGRESYFQTADWGISDPIDHLICSIRVDPCLWAEAASAHYFTAPCAAALPFKYWTGTMKFRFQFVCSSFHKGRVRIVYDPNQISGTPEWNVNYMEVVDLAEKHDCTISVGMGQPTTYREHYLPGTDVIGSIYDALNPLTTNSTKGNGTLNMYVVNTLTSPNSTVTNNISVNIYVSMGDDFEVAVPDAYFQNFVFKPQSGDEAEMKPSTTESFVVSEGLNATEQNAPMHSESQNIAVVNNLDNKVNLVFFGETVQSFRPMLKRYNKWRAMGPYNGPVLIRDQFNMFPFLRGGVAGAIDTRVGPAQYNYVNTVLLHWVTYMFSGWRGSIRYKLIPKGVFSSSDFLVTRFAIDSNASGYDSAPTSIPLFGSGNQLRESIVYEYGTASPSFYGKYSSGANGSTFTRSPMNSILEFEVPFYSQHRFIAGKVEDWSNSNDKIGFFSVEGLTPEATTSLSSWYELWVAAGEDFQVYFYTGLPKMYFEPAPPIPV